MTNEKMNSMIVTLVMLALAIFVTLLIIFSPELTKSFKTAIKDLFTFEETNPTGIQRDFYAGRQGAGTVQTKIITTMERMAASNKDVCFGAMDSIEVMDPTFYSNQYALTIAKDKSGDYKVTLMQYKKDEIEQNGNKKIVEGWQPAGIPVPIEGVIPCIVYESGNVNNFFNVFLSGNNFDKTFVESKNYGIGLSRLSIRQDDKNTDNEMFYGLNNGDSEEGSLNLYPGEEVSKLILLKQGKNICFIPSVNEGRGCSGPSGGDKLLDEDCLDDQKAGWFFGVGMGNEYKLPNRLRKYFVTDFACDAEFKKEINAMVATPIK